ncbi:MAG: DUF3775 domain-containing protein [Pyrinomonadaceae bacterium]
MRTLHLSAAVVEHISELKSVADRQRPMGLGEGKTSRAIAAKQQLRETIDSLSEDERIELEAISWLGHEHFKSFDQAFAYARVATTGGLSIHLADKSSLDYLWKGTHLLDKEGIKLS